MYLKRFLTCTFALSFVFFLFVTFSPKANAGCASCYYCIGNRDTNYRNGCQGTSPNCTQKLTYGNLTCTDTTACSTSGPTGSYCCYGGTNCGTYSCTRVASPVNCCAQSPAIPGVWSGWSSCSNCTQTRSCTPPSCGGTPCSGSGSQSCGTVSGGWTTWSSCPACGTNVSQTRTCTNPSPACGGADCSLLDGGNSSRLCAIPPCCTLVNGGWSDWSACLPSCGPGNKTRTCSNPAPSCGGADCSLLDGGNPSQPCNNGSCRICGAGILYIEGNPGDKVIFSNSFTTTSDPALIVTDLPVVISSGVGIPPVAGVFNFPITTTPSIDAAILTSQTITVERKATLGTDNVIMLQGPFISKQSIVFERDVGSQNSKTPAEAVKYDPTYLGRASKLEKSHPEAKSYTGLGIFSVQWNYSE